MTNGNAPRRLGMQGFRGLRQRGMGYLLVLFAVAAMGLSLAGSGEVLHTQSLREKETQLLFIGQQFRAALASYRDRSPAGAPSAPASLNDLLRDPRFAQPVHHLRRLWRDPTTNNTDWALLIADGRIIGIHSRSVRKPLRTVFDTPNAVFSGLSSYDQWVFVADAPVAAPNPSLRSTPTP
jgi:type II secretory pathway pseudopilin PulG